jgi:DNA-binding transcriptional ArsR family regulator
LEEVSLDVASSTPTGVAGREAVDAFPVETKGNPGGRVFGSLRLRDSRLPIALVRRRIALAVDTAADPTYFPCVEISSIGKHTRLAGDPVGSLSERSESEGAIGAVFAALSDPTRRRIVEALDGGESTVGDLATRLGVGTPAMSKHLTVLQKAGLVSRRRDAQRRLCRLEPAGFHDLNEWSRRYERLWAGSLDNLDTYIAELAAGEQA